MINKTDNRASKMDKFLLWPLFTVLAVFTTTAFIDRIVTTDLFFYSSFVVLAFIVGACSASFIAAMVERLPKGESPNTPSHCICGRNLKPWENVPLIGWLTVRIASKGLTRCCGAKLPSWYFLFEGISGFSFAALGIFFILNEQFNPFILFTAGIVVIAIIALASDYRNTISNDYSGQEQS